MTNSERHPNQIKCAISTVTLIENDVLEILIEGNQEIEIEDTQELVEAAGKLGGGKRLLSLIVVERGSLPTKEARDFSASNEGSKYKLAEAYVVQSLAQRIIGNFIVGVQSRTVPAKLFGNRVDALKWLKSLDIKGR